MHLRETCEDLMKVVLGQRRGASYINPHTSQEAS